nr:hypothetical protein [uncultured organism]
MSEQLFCIGGGRTAKEPRLYENCGLDNIWLMDGYSVIPRDGEDFVDVEDVEGLHKAIALHLVRHRGTLGGSEIKFIRYAIDLTQPELAHRLGTSAQTVARWEKGKVAIPAPEEKLLRFTTVLAVAEPEKFAEIIRAMPVMSDGGNEGPVFPARFKHDAGWTEAFAEAA